MKHRDTKTTWPHSRAKMASDFCGALLVGGGVGTFGTYGRGPEF